MPSPKFRSIIQENIQNGKTEKAINILLTSSESSSDLHNQVLILSNRFQEQKRKQRLGIASQEVIEIEKNKISLALLELVDTIDRSKEAKLLHKVDRFSDSFTAKYYPFIIASIGLLLVFLAVGWKFSYNTNTEKGAVPLYIIITFSFGMAAVVFGLLRAYALYKGRYIRSLTEIGVPIGSFLIFAFLGYYYFSSQTIDYTIHLTEINKHIPIKNLAHGTVKVFFKDGSYKEAPIIQGIATISEMDKLTLGQPVTIDIIGVQGYSVSSTSVNHLLTITPIKVPLEQPQPIDEKAKQDIPEINVNGNNAVITILGDSSEVNQTFNN